KTVAVAEEAGAVVVRHRRNKGYGGALNTIFSTAKKYKPDILVIIDSDGQHNPEDVTRFVSKIAEGYDVVIGSRFLTQESKAVIPGYRKLGMKVLDTATDMVMNGAHVSDSQSGFRAYTRDAYNVVNISGNGMSAGSEILMQISDRKLAIGEIPISVRYDLEDTSSQNPIRHGVSVLMNLVRFISIRRPMTFFGLGGGFVLLVGLGLCIWALQVFMMDGSLPLTIALGGGLIVIIGLLLMVSGLILYSISQMMSMVVVGKY
ncbi:MAG TPA: glycosyltransferase family 2 protein, partial [Methanocorpusculum sp.]|nr:glycosyltransferase family 2 protein [Methanocorpusculum sp.]